MPRQIFMPAEVVDSIRGHLEAAIDRFVDSYWSGNEDEDALTGQLGFALRTGVHAVQAVQDQSELPGQWKWSIDCAKFRGRGKHATESLVGADGIIELRVMFGTRQEFKSLLFQSALILSTRRCCFRRGVRQQLALAYHPDSYLESLQRDLATSRMQEVNAAYDELHGHRRRRR